RARIYCAIERLDEAIEVSRSSAEVFLRFGDLKRHFDAKMTEAAYLFQSGSVREALAIWQALADEREATSELTRVGLIHNIGLCYRELHELDKAATALQDAMTQFESLGMETERVRSRCALAATLVA